MPYTDGFRFELDASSCILTSKGYIPLYALRSSDILFAPNTYGLILQLYPQAGEFYRWEYYLDHLRFPIITYRDLYVYTDTGVELPIRAASPDVLLQRVSSLGNQDFQFNWFPALVRVYLTMRTRRLLAQKVLDDPRKYRQLFPRVLRAQYLLRGFPEQLPRGLLKVSTRGLKKIVDYFQPYLRRRRVIKSCSLPDALHLADILLKAGNRVSIQDCHTFAYIAAADCSVSDQNCVVRSNNFYKQEATRYVLVTTTPVIVVSGLPVSAVD